MRQENCYPRRLPSASRLIYSLALVVAVVIGLSSPAAAHDELMSSSPADDSTAPEAPTEVVLTFGGEPLSMGATIIVADADGADWANGPAQVDGSAVTAALRTGMSDGFYQVRWRIVSEDGAIVSGHFDFGIGDTSGAEPVALPATAPASADGQPAGGDFDLDQPENRNGDPAAAAVDTGSQRLSTPLVALGGAVAGLVLAAVYGAITHPRRPVRDGDRLPMEEP